MRQILIALFLCITLAAAEAGTWRSTSGNMFHFYPGGTMTAYIQGKAYNGRWWWTRSPYQFQYNFGYKTVTVDIKQDGAIAMAPAENPQYWTQMSRRGAEEEAVDRESWFMEQVAP